MPGIVVRDLRGRSPATAVEAGTVRCLILEAMKMQNEIAAPAAGTVKAVHVEEKQAVGSGEKLVTLEGE